jgi:protein-tyrosine-phosphatase
MAEALLRHRGSARFEVFSAGSHPAGYVHPYTVRVLEESRVRGLNKLRSKSWDEFKDQDFDAVVTLCDYAREQDCPVWPRREGSILPVVAHWGLPDPSKAHVVGILARLEAFRHVRDRIRESIERLVVAPKQWHEHDESFANLLGRIGKELEEIFGERPEY